MEFKKFFNFSPYLISGSSASKRFCLISNYHFDHILILFILSLYPIDHSVAAALE